MLTYVNRMKLQVLLWALVHLGVALSGQVNIEYNKPVLKLTLPSFTTSDVGRVSFRYTVNSLQKHGVGVLTTEGWQYQTSDVSLDGADEVSAYAVIYDLHGNLKEVTLSDTDFFETGELTYRLKIQVTISCEYILGVIGVHLELTVLRVETNK
uniref:Cadherin domain-containing protein n=1 Tax=Biomphalaria glabrata TaxID=6526 RepID=A0A2C9L4I0_BIOGL